jgi:hypothetical protein
MFICLFLAQQPPVGQGLLIHQASTSHTTTHHSQQDSTARVISSLQRPLPDNTQHTTDKHPCPQWDSNPQLIVLFYVLSVSNVLFYVLFVCKCLLYYCHWVSTPLQLNNISYYLISASERPQTYALDGTAIGIGALLCTTSYSCNMPANSCNNYVHLYMEVQHRSFLTSKEMRDTLQSSKNC